MRKRICKTWALPVDLSAWLGEVSDRVISVVDEEGSPTVKQSCQSCETPFFSLNLKLTRC
jgi:hypothetical protein